MWQKQMMKRNSTKHFHTIYVYIFGLSHYGGRIAIKMNHMQCVAPTCDETIFEIKIHRAAHAQTTHMYLYDFIIIIGNGIIIFFSAFILFTQTYVCKHSTELRSNTHF